MWYYLTIEKTKTWLRAIEADSPKEAKQKALRMHLADEPDFSHVDVDVEEVKKHVE